MNKIYQFLVDNTWLEESHKQELIKKRGFTTEIIEKYKLRSSGSYIKKMKQTFLDEFSEEELIESGVLTEKLNFKPCLLHSNILIPYLDADGMVEYLRPHKAALSGTNIPIFCPYNLKNHKGLIVFTEGEFKAIAGMQYGFPIVSVHGITAYVGKKFKELISFLQENQIKRVVILFDNEVKDDPSLESFIAKESDRYNTQFYAYWTAKKITNNKTYPIEALVAKLPDEWRIREEKIKEKIDIDGCLTLGKTKKEIVSEIMKALPYKEYLKSQPEKIKQVMLKKNDLFSLKKYVTEDFGQYVALRPPVKGQIDPQKEIISNFTMEIVATYKTPKGIMRQIVLKNKNGKMSEHFFIEGSNMIRSEKFAEFCLMHGNFLWTGTRADLSFIWQRLFLKGSDVFIEEFDHIGYIKELDLWLFSNMVIKNDVPILPDKNGVFWIGEKGIKPISCNVKRNSSDELVNVPKLSSEPIDLKEIHDKLADSMTLNNARLALGWLVSIFFIEDVYAKNRCFPFFFVFGRTKRGKTTIVQWLMWMLGIESQGKKIKDTTSVSIQRMLGYFSSYPLFMDDYRNLKTTVYKNEVFRSAYNRESAMKGIKDSFGIREEVVRGTLIFTGEDLPDDSALLSRNLCIQIPEREAETNHYSWFVEQGVNLSYFSYYILTNKSKIKEKYFEVFENAKQAFIANNIDDRTALHFAIAAAGYYSVFGINGNADFHDWMKTQAKVLMNDQDEEHIYSTFWEDVSHMILTNKIIRTDYFHKPQGTSHLCIYFYGLYNEWELNCRTRGKEIPIKKKGISKQLSEEKCFIEANKNVRFNDSQKKCFILAKETAPQYILSLFEEDDVQPEIL